MRFRKQKVWGSNPGARGLILTVQEFQLFFERIEISSRCRVKIVEISEIFDSGKNEPFEGHGKSV